MKKIVAVSAIGVIAAAILAFFLLSKERPGTPSPERSPSDASKAQRTTSPGTDSSPDSTPQPTATAANQPLNTDQGSTNAAPVTPEQLREKAVRVRVGQVLATVNGTSITLRDLMAIDSSEDPENERSLSEEGYKYLLDRAIDRELAFQAAQHQGIQLSQEQQAQLDRVEKSIRGRDSSDAGSGVTRLNSPANLEDLIKFETRDAAGLLMQGTLVDKAGGPPLLVTEDQVRRHYELNANRYGALPAPTDERELAWRQIDAQIRRELMYSNMESHQAASTEYMDKLKAAADITITDVKNQQP